MEKRSVTVSTPLTAEALLKARERFERRHGTVAITSENFKELIEEVISPRPLDQEPPPPVAPGKVRSEFPKTFDEVGPDNQVIRSQTVKSLAEQTILMRTGGRWYARQS